MVIKNSQANVYFTAEEKAKIEEAIRGVENSSMGEVVAMVVDSSDRYPEAAITGGVFLSSVVSLTAAKFFLGSSLWYFILLQFFLFFPFRFLLEASPFLKAMFIGPRSREERVRQRALEAFYEKGLYKTRGNTGVLFFLSLYERKVWVLADKGIYEKIQQETVESFARAVSQGIKEGRGSEALCKAIQDAGNLISRHFPLEPGDTNELPDKVITE
jgi:putative membrane protein